MSARLAGWLLVVLGAGQALAGVQESSSEPRRPNVLLLCIDDLRPELGSFGVAAIHSPNIDRLAEEGRPFPRHYVQAPTCGASRFSLLTGRYGVEDRYRGNEALVEWSRDPAASTPTLPAWLRGHGYRTVSIGKISHYPGGHYGTDWNDPDKVEMPGAFDVSVMPTGAWRSPQGAMHGLANGHVRGAKDTSALEAFDGPDESYPDGLTLARALEELDSLAAGDGPFFLAVGLLKPHLPLGAPKRYFDLYEGVSFPPVLHPERPEGRSTWHASQEFFGRYLHGDRDPRTDAEYAALVHRHYAACVSFSDALVGRLLAGLEALGLRKDTVVVLWGDHGWHLGEHAVFGKHTLFEESLCSPLIVCAEAVRSAGVPASGIVETVDVYPTLCELCGLAPPDGIVGRSLLPALQDPAAPGRAALSYQPGRESLRDERYHLVRHREKGRTVFAELYDHDTDPGESANVAERLPEVVAAMEAEIERRLGSDER